MHAFLNILAATSTTTKSSHKSSGSTYTLLFIVAIFGGIYFLLIRPRQQKMRAQQTQARQLSVGDEVVSAGGIYGRVVAMDADVAEVEVAPGIVMKFLRRAISAAPGGNPPPKPEPSEDEWPRPQDRATNAGEDDPPGDQPEPRP